MARRVTMMGDVRRCAYCGDPLPGGDSWERDLLPGASLPVWSEGVRDEGG